MNTLEILNKVDELFSDESKWTTGTFARSSKYSKIAVEIDNPNADCFCIYGGFMYVLYKAGEPSEFIANPIFDNFLDPAIQNYKNDPKISVGDFNDDPNTTFKDVKKFLAFCKERAL